MNVSDTDNEDVDTNYLGYEKACQIVWLVGIAVSCVGVVVQVGLACAVRACRGHDERLLAALAACRLAHSACEYAVLHVDRVPARAKDVLFTLYVQLDFALVCWMFVFSKNLYNKIVVVFVTKRCSLVTTAAVILGVSLPVGLVCPLLMSVNVEYFRKYYLGYAVVKFVIIVVNIVLFVEIFRVAIATRSNRKRNVTHFVHSAVIFVILVSITSLQVLTTDILSVLVGDHMVLVNTFCVINSFQVVSITVIFIILAKNKVKAARRKSMSIRMTEMV